MGSGVIEALEATTPCAIASTANGEASLNWLTIEDGAWASPWPLSEPLDGARLDAAITTTRQQLSDLEKVAEGQTLGVIEIPVAKDPLVTVARQTYTRMADFFASIGWLNAADTANECIQAASPPIVYAGSIPVVARSAVLDLIRRGDEAASANPLLTATNRHIFLHNEHAATIRLTINQGHAAFLIRNRKRFLVFVISVKASLVKVLAHARRVASGALAIIAVFMSHRHRHEPADGWLLPKASTQSLAGCISR